jgi:hypothetical protein
MRRPSRSSRSESHPPHRSQRTVQALLSLAVVAATTATVLPVGLASAAPHAAASSVLRAAPRPTVAPVLARARAALAGDTAASQDARQGARRATHPDARRSAGTPEATPGRPRATVEDASLALRRLFVALPRLDAADRRAARQLLARPTDGPHDTLGDGYTVPSRRACRGPVCIHWVTSTKDAPPNRGWVDRTLAYMGHVWRVEVGRMGYRAPLSDGHRGGDGRLDVYLKDVGSRGIYGYCVPETRDPDHKWLASGYCVLDDDFARSQFGARPRASLHVTAAHEFFHAVQFAYDYGEDQWLMEASATWMEEQVADAVDDNRQYLPFGQLGRPGHPLDTFAGQGFEQYGNWPFFQFLSSRYGARVVRRIWDRAGEFPRGGHDYSVTAVEDALQRHGGFADVFRRYAAAMTVPATAFDEGSRWPKAAAAAVWRLSARSPAARRRMSLDHLTYRQVLARPARGLTGRWRLRVTVDAPGARTAPAAYVVVRTAQGTRQRPLAIGAAGAGSTSVAFRAGYTRAVHVVVVNGSTRYRCWRRTSWACQGRARDDREPFTVAVTAVHRRPRHR